MIPVIFIIIIINIIIMEPQTSIITSVIINSFLLMISVTLHTDLWKLAPYFKKKKKEFATLLYVTEEL